jgi:glycogen synthase kinase 3 beta
LCDFGSAKRILPGDKSVSYIASRFYRGPELILGCEYYRSSIDIWAAGCCLAEILTAGLPLFQGSFSTGELLEIVKVIGPPTEEDLASFRHGANIEMASSNISTLENVLPRHTPGDILDLLSLIFTYQPDRRPSALTCMRHRCFDEIFAAGMAMPNGRPFPVLDRS